MAQLKDTVVTGNLRVTDTTLTDELQVDTIKTHSSSGANTLTAGTDGQILKTNGTSSYWGSVTLDNVADGTTRKLSDYAPKASPALTGTPTAPTATAGTNTTQIATTAFVTNAVTTAIGSVYRVKGTKATYADLPSSGNVAGDVWNVTAAYGNYPPGTNWVWTGSAWDALGGEIDLSGKQDVLTFDTTPTENSINPITSGGVYASNYAGSTSNGGPANMTVSIPFAKPDSTSTSTVYTVQVPGITELRDGVCFYLMNNKVTSASGFTINVNSLGDKTVYLTTAAATRATTQMAVNYTWLLVYNETRITDGCWDLVYTYNTNSTYTLNYLFDGSPWYLQHTLYRYQLMFQVDEKTVTPLNVNSNSTGTTKTIHTDYEFDPFGKIFHYTTTTTINTNATVSGSYCAFVKSAVDLRYTFNVSTTVNPLSLDYSPVYIKININPTTGMATLNSELPLTQTLPTTNDGIYYLYLGRSTSTKYTCSLEAHHPIYYHNGSTLCELLPNDTLNGIEDKLGFVPISEYENDQSTISTALDDLSDRVEVVEGREWVTSEPYSQIDSVLRDTYTKSEIDAMLENIEGGGSEEQAVTSVTVSGSGNAVTNATFSNKALTLTKGNIATPGTLTTTSTTALSTASNEALSGSINLHKVAKTGTYSDLIGKPTIPAAQVQSDWNATSGMGVILNKPTIPDTLFIAGDGTNGVKQVSIPSYNTTSGNGAVALNISSTVGNNTLSANTAIARGVASTAIGQGLSIGSSSFASGQRDYYNTGYKYSGSGTSFTVTITSEQLEAILGFTDIVGLTGRFGTGSNVTTAVITSASWSSSNQLVITTSKDLGTHTNENFYIYCSPTAIGDGSHAEGNGTIALNKYEHAEGNYNASFKVDNIFGNAGNTLYSIGVGTSPIARINAIEVKQNGDVYVKGIGSYDGTNYSSASTLQSIVNNASGGSSGTTEIFWAVYGTTTYTEVVNAYNSGKLCACKYNGHMYYLSAVRTNVAYVTDVVYFDELGGSGNEDTTTLTVYVRSDDVWDNETGCYVVGETSATRWDDKYTKPSSGIPASDLASAVQTSLGKADTALQSFTETDPVFSASAAAGITSSDITNWNSKTSNTGTLTGVKFNNVDATVSNGVASISATIPAAVTESTVAGWGFTKNTGTLTSHALHELVIEEPIQSQQTLVPGQTIDVVTSLTGTSVATSGDLTLTPTMQTIYIPKSPGTLNTTNTTSQTTSSNESLSNSINLHKISKTGSYSDLIDAPINVSDFVNDCGYISTETALSKGTTTGSGNAVTDITVNGHQITLTKGATFLTSQDISGKASLSGAAFTGAVTGTSSGNTAQFRNVTISSSEPTASDGNNGDIWIVI